ncbi:BANK1 protein, partial [Sapayoa aenigma]|nr:BANK1 protein [Sapayoa aenigma]
EEDSEEKHPYIAVKLDGSVYDFIPEEEERRKHCRSFIMNRPPASAPRPIRLPIREENIPYIAQVMNKMFKMLLCCQRVMIEPSFTHFSLHFLVARWGHAATVTYSTVKHIVPAEQEELIQLQEQVKKGAISVDEALDRFKQWQKEKERLQPTQQ